MTHEEFASLVRDYRRSSTPLAWQALRDRAQECGFRLTSDSQQVLLSALPHFDRTNYWSSYQLLEALFVQDIPLFWQHVSHCQAGYCFVLNHDYFSLDIHEAANQAEQHRGMSPIECDNVLILCSPATTVLICWPVPEHCKTCTDAVVYLGLLPPGGLEEFSKCYITK